MAEKQETAVENLAATANSNHELQQGNASSLQQGEEYQDTTKQDIPETSTVQQDQGVSRAQAGGQGEPAPKAPDSAAANLQQPPSADARKHQEQPSSVVGNNNEFQRQADAEQPANDASNAASLEGTQQSADWQQQEAQKSSAEHPEATNTARSQADIAQESNNSASSSASRYIQQGSKTSIPNLQYQSHSSIRDDYTNAGSKPGAESTAQKQLRVQKSGNSLAGPRNSHPEQHVNCQLPADLHQQDQEARLAMEKKARQELEDMLLRLEYHFQAELSRREAAEAAAADAQAAADSARAELAATTTAEKSRAASIAAEQQQLAEQRQSLDKMRTELEAELQQARAEVAKAQEALAHAEDKVRQEAREERMRLEAGHRSQMDRMEATVVELQAQLRRRTSQLTSEMLRWKQQAELAANAVIDAKDEVLARKRELDTTKVRMDELIDKLYTGRELGIDLGGQIAGAMSLYQTMTGSPPVPLAPPNLAAFGHPTTLVRTRPTSRLPPAQAQLHENFMPPGIRPFPAAPGTTAGIPGFLFPQLPVPTSVQPKQQPPTGKLPTVATSTRQKAKVSPKVAKQPQQSQTNSRTLRSPDAYKPEPRNDAYLHVQSRHMARAGTYASKHGTTARNTRQTLTQRKSKPARELNEQEQRMIAHTARWM